MMTKQFKRINPELADALKTMQIGENGIFDITNIPATREAVRQISESISLRMPDDSRISVQEYQVKSNDGYNITVRILRPKFITEPIPLLVWFHGGGQILGYAAQEDPILKTLIANTGCAVASIDYRLAPEYPSPTGAEDGFTVWKWLVESAEKLNFDIEHMAISGASGGGCIAAGTTLLIRERNVKAPKFQGLLYPMLDDRCETPSSHLITDIGIWDRHTNILAWKIILGEKYSSDEVSVYSAPARENNFKNLPGTFIAVGEMDLFRDEDINYALRLQQDDVPVELHLFPGAYHAFDLFAPTSLLSKTFLFVWYNYIKRQFDTKELDELN